MNNILEIEGLTFRYEDRNVLENINLQVPKELLGLVDRMVQVNQLYLSVY